MKKIYFALLTGLSFITTPASALEWADFYHCGESIYEVEAYGRIVEDAYSVYYPWHHEVQFETQYYHPDPNYLRHAFTRVRHNAKPDEVEMYGWKFTEYQQLILKDNRTRKRVINVFTKDRGGIKVYRHFQGNLELKECKEPLRNDVEVVGDYRYVRRHTEKKVYSIPQWLDPHLVNVQEGQVFFDAAKSIGAQAGFNLGKELAIASIPWRVAGKGLWYLKMWPVKWPTLKLPIEGRGPRNLFEQVVMRSAQSGEYSEIAMKGPFKDPKFKSAGWVKKRLSRQNCSLEECVVHYMHNILTGEMTQFKFKK